MAPLLARRKRASTAINEAQKKMCRTRFAGLSALSEADAGRIQLKARLVSTAARRDGAPHFISITARCGRKLAHRQQRLAVVPAVHAQLQPKHVHRGWRRAGGTASAAASATRRAAHPGDVRPMLSAAGWPRCGARFRCATRGARRCSCLASARRRGGGVRGL
jgi:hypothetical protein